MNKKIMQQALTVLKAWDALIKYQYGGSSEAMTAMQNVAWNTVDVIKALEIALAQPEQEPVAYWNGKNGFICADQIKYISIWSDYYPEPLYALPTVSSENSMQAVDHGFDRTASHMAGEYMDTNQQNVNTSEERVQVSDKFIPEWQGLTDDDIAESAERMEAVDPTDSFWREFSQAIEAKLREKNATQN